MTAWPAKAFAYLSMSSHPNKNVADIMIVEIESFLHCI